MFRPNIVLTGFMGTGKSTVGQFIAQYTGREFVDTDEIIQSRSGRSIREIFAADGEETFRRMEAELALELSEKKNYVIATGGKMALDPVNAVFLNEGGPVFCLEADHDEIIRRLGGEKNRPLLDSPDPISQVKSLLAERASGYDQFPKINTSGRLPQDVSNEIISKVDSLLVDGLWKPAHQSRLVVGYPGGSYAIQIGHSILPELTDRIPEVGDYVIVSDTRVGPLYSQHIGTKKPQAILQIPEGEDYKNLETMNAIYRFLIDSGLDRSGTIAALGGGVVGDIAGFAAATYMRGIQLVQCPTTLLALVDASIGGKTGLDLAHGKNMVGAFKQPVGVAADLKTLKSLPEPQLKSGMAEVIKHGLIASPRLLDWIQKGWWRLNGTGDHYKFQALVVEAVTVKRRIVQEDPFESGRRAILNLGHTFAHAIESVSDFRIGHGRAVSMGLAAAAHLSHELGYCSGSLFRQVEAVIGSVGLPSRIPGSLSSSEIYEAMGLDKKKKGGRLRFILLRDIGDPLIVADVPRQAVVDTLEAVKDGA